MKTALEVKDRDEAFWIKRALSSPAFRDFVVVAGRLLSIDAPYIPRVISDLTDTLRTRLEQEREKASVHSTGDDA